jgi:hypothetical protein
MTHIGRIGEIEGCYDNEKKENKRRINMPRYRDVKVPKVIGSVVVSTFVRQMNKWVKTDSYVKNNVVLNAEWWAKEPSFGASKRQKNYFDYKTGRRLMERWETIGPGGNEKVVYTPLADSELYVSDDLFTINEKYLK